MLSDSDGFGRFTLTRQLASLPADPSGREENFRYHQAAASMPLRDGRLGDRMSIRALLLKTTAAAACICDSLYSFRAWCRQVMLCPPHRPLYRQLRTPARSALRHGFCGRALMAASAAAASATTTETTTTSLFRGPANELLRFA